MGIFHNLEKFQEAGKTTTMKRFMKLTNYRMSHRYWAMNTKTSTGEYINEYSLGSRVQVQVPEYRSPTSVLFRSRFPSTGPGSQVQILNNEILSNLQISLKIFYLSFLD